MNITDVGLKFNGLKTSNNVPKSIVAHHIEANGWTVERLHNMHKNDFGWAGIGYHFYIRKDGMVYKGRPENARGAHVDVFNVDSLGIAFEGDYNKIDKEMPQAQFNAWVELKDYLFKKYGELRVYGHREVGASDCPGQYFPLEKIKKGAEKKYYVVTDYLPVASESYPGIDINSILNPYFVGVKTYLRNDNKGIWIETQYLDYNRCLELKDRLGNLFWKIKED